MKTVLTCLLLACVSAMAELGRYDVATKHWEVDTGVLKCTFFQGCMYPVWFKGADDAKFPFFVFADTIVHDRTPAYLREERWATFRVVENNALRFIMECQGNFCYGTAPFNKPDENVEAVYRYAFERGSGEVGLMVRLRKNEGIAYDVQLCSLRWRYLPFERYGELELKNALKFSEDSKQEPARLCHSSMDFWLGEHPVVLRREPAENTFFYLKDATGRQSWPATSTELRFETRLCFGKSEKEVGK